MTTPSWPSTGECPPRTGRSWRRCIGCSIACRRRSAWLGLCATWKANGWRMWPNSVAAPWARPSVGLRRPTRASSRRSAMSGLAKRVRVLGERLAAGYDPQGAEPALERLHRGLRRRRRRRVAASLAVVLLLAGGSLWMLRPREVAQGPRGPERRPVLFSLSDGSTVERLDGPSQLEARTVTADLVELELRAGGARFDVTPNSQRRFRVLA